MPHSYVCSYHHCVFSTKDRRPLITPELCERLWAYMGGIARENGMNALQVGGTENHAHVLLALPATIALAKAIQLIKGGSSKWVGEALSLPFAWQEGYAAFSVSASMAATVSQYIRNQPEHHRRTTFDEEFLTLLQKHGLEYDPRYVFG